MTRSKTRAKKKAQQAPGSIQQPQPTEDAAVQRNGNGFTDGQQQQHHHQHHHQHRHNSNDYSHSQSHPSAHQYAHSPHQPHAPSVPNGFPPSSQQPPQPHPRSVHQQPLPELSETQKKMVPISDKALAMLNHMLGNRGMMQRDPSTGAIDVVLNTELFPNLTLPFPALEIPSKGSGDPEEDIRDVLQKVAGGALGGMVGLPGMQGQAPGQGQGQHQSQQQMIGNALGAGLGVGPGGKLPNLEDLLKLPIFQTGTNENAPALSKYLFQPHPSSSAPYTVSPAQAQAQAQQQQQAAKGKNRQQQPLQQSIPPPASTLPMPQSQPHRSTVPPSARNPASDVSPAPMQHVDARSPPPGLVAAGSGSNSSSTEELTQHMCPHCDEMHSSRAYTDEEYDEDDEEYDSYYASEESFEYDAEDDDLEEIEDDEGLHPDDASHLSHAPESYDEDEEDEEGVDGEVDTFSIGEIEDELGPEREDEREEAREFFSRVFGKGKEKQRQVVPPSSASPGGAMAGAGGDPQQQQQPHHVCGPECREPTPRQLSEARLQKELFFEKMKVAFMYDGWPEELLKKKWSELTDKERDYIRRTVLARATDGPICEDEKSKARLMKKGWPESALDKRWSELTDTERKRILQVEAATAGQDDGLDRASSNVPREAVPPHTNGAAAVPPQMPGGWTGAGAGAVTGTGGKPDPVLLSVGGTLVEDAHRADADALREAILQYGSVIGPYTAANAQDKLAFPEITGPNGQATALDEPTKAEVRKKLARFHAKATETAKWIMSHLETSSGIDPYLRGSLEEAKQVFEDFRTNFKVPDFLQEQMDVATIMYDDLNGTNLSQLPPGVDSSQPVEEAPPTTNGTGEGKKKKKKQKKKKKRKSGTGGQQQGQGDDDRDGGNDDQDGSEEEAGPGGASLLDNPENMDWACNELFQWIKAVVWSIEQDAIRAGRAAAVSKSNSNKKKGGNKKSEDDFTTSDIQITWNLPEQLGSQTDQTNPGRGQQDAGTTTITYTPTPAPDAEQLRARLRSVGVEVGPT